MAHDWFGICYCCCCQSTISYAYTQEYTHTAQYTRNIDSFQFRSVYNLRSNALFPCDHFPFICGFLKSFIFLQVNRHRGSSRSSTCRQQQTHTVRYAHMERYFNGQCHYVQPNIFNVIMFTLYRMQSQRRYTEENSENDKGNPYTPTKIASAYVPYGENSNPDGCHIPSVTEFHAKIRLINEATKILKTCMGSICIHNAHKTQILNSPQGACIGVNIVNISDTNCHNIVRK